MTMTLDKKKIIWCIAIVILAVAIYYFFFRKKAESSYHKCGHLPNGGSTGNGDNPTPPPVPTTTTTPEDVTALPGFFQLQFNIAIKGKKSVFPMTLEKVTDGPIELPNRRSLLSKDVNYKFIDIMPGDKIKAVSLQRLNYTADKNAFTDDFLVTDNDYVIAYSQAKEHFKIVV